jgi:hypothetical protein
MACHTANLAFMGLKLTSPTSIVAQAGDVNPETGPSWAQIKFEFPAVGDRGPITFNWYEGKRNIDKADRKSGNKVLPPADLLAKVLRPNEKLVDSGSIIVGDKGILYSPNDYGADFRICPEAEFKGMNLRTPEKLTKNNGGDDGQKKEWIEAIKASKPELAFSNFDYAGLLTEAILLGNVAIRTGKPLQWDAENLTCTNCPEAAQYIKLAARKGWEIDPLV